MSQSQFRKTNREMTNTQTGAIDAETRGRLRLWKAAQRRHYDAIGRNLFQSKVTYRAVYDMCARSSRMGRQRAFERIRLQMAAAGATLEGVRLDGREPVVGWTVLKPRDAVAVDHPDPSKQQPCVTVNYA